ncbi:MAG: right-handed parallel beta-helix repeat-containing protein [Planctomycetota bacterium]
MFRRCIAVLTLSACSHNITSAQILYVDQNASGADNGSSWSNAFTSLNRALDAANVDEEIWVAQGRYIPDDPAGRDATFLVGNRISIYGGFVGGETDRDDRDPQDNETVLDGNNNSYTVVTIGGNNTVVDGFSIVGGRADGSTTPRARGAGIFGEDIHTTIRNCVFRDNESVTAGSAIAIEGASPNITFIEDCLFADNIGTFIARINVSVRIADCVFRDGDSGGLVLDGDDVVSTVNDCTFANLVGAGPISVVSNSGAVSSIRRTVFSNNEGTFGGGVSYSQGGSHAIAHCIFRGNTGVGSNLPGGAVTSRMIEPDAELRIFNTLFTGNLAPGGGAMVVNSGPVAGLVRLSNCTLASNLVNGPTAAGLLVGATSTVEINNTIIYDNITAAGQGDERESVLILPGGSVSANRSIIEFLGVSQMPDVISAVASSDADPLLADPRGPDGLPGTLDDNLRLRPGSPAIDAGNNNLYLGLLLTDDVYGQTRLLDDTGTPDTGVSFGSDPVIDIGAAEFQGTTTSDCLADTNGDGVVSPGDFTAWVIAFNNQLPACDQNGDGLCNPGDLNAWVINFNAGC